MIRNFLCVVFSLSLGVSAFAKKATTPTPPSTQQPATEEVADNSSVTSQDSFQTHLMKGLNVSVAWASMNADVHIKVKSGLSSDMNGNTNTGANALGVSVYMADLERNKVGWLIGGSIITKIDNSSSASNSLSSSKAITQLRPEANLAYALNNGIWGMAGGHLSGMFGDEVKENISPIGAGFQIGVGYVPVKNYGLDISYYMTVHKISDDSADGFARAGIYVDRDQSWYIFKQLQARMTYFF